MRIIFEILSFASLSLFIYLIVRVLLIRKIKFILIIDLLRTIFVFYISVLIFVFFVSSRNHADYILYNFIPFHTINEYLVDASTTNAIKNLIGNVIIVVPLGFFIYIKLKVISKIQIVIYSICIPFIIEFTQFFIYLLGLGSRSIDVDDIILNSLGILLGYNFTRFISKIKLKNLKNDNEKGYIDINEN